MIEPGRYEQVIWDWNGTLMDDGWLCVEIINEVMERRGMPAVSIDDYRQHFDFPVIVYYQRMGFDLERESFEDISVEFITEYDRRRFECGLHPRVENALQRFRDAGCGQSILSAYRHPTLIEVIGHYGLSRWFNRLVGQNNILGESKVEMGKQLAADLGCAPKKILLIGDTRHDHEVAEAIGADCLLVSHGHHNATRLAETGAPVLESVEALLNGLPAG